MTDAPIPEPTPAERQQIDEIKNGLGPVIDAALLQLIRGADASMAQVADAEIERCIGIARSAQMKPPIPPSLLGWNEAVEFIVRQLESWRKKAAEP